MSGGFWGDGKKDELPVRYWLSKPIHKELVMTIVVLKLKDVKRNREDRPEQCPYCERETFQRWGQVKKPVKDTLVRSVKVYRYRCCHCRRTFRYYPEGLSKADQSERLKQFAAICWTLGLSHRGVSFILSGWKVWLGHMSVWRDVQAEAGVRKRQNQKKKVRVLGLDGAYVLGWGEKQPVLVGVDMGDGQVVALGYLNEHDPHAVQRWLEGLVKHLGVSVIVTDDLMSYHWVAEKLNLGHQVCQFHVRRWVGQTLKDLREKVPKNWHWILDEIEQLIDVLPPEGDKRLYALWKQLGIRRSGRNKPLTALEQLRALLWRLSQAWQSYCTFQHEPDVPWTNNATEQAIGRMKMRARTVRGYKTWPGMHNGFLIAGSNGE
jgi:transposase-like protein